MTSVSMTFCRHGNFGDKLNLSMAQALGIGLHRHAFAEKVEEDVSVLGIGTILTARLQVAPSTRLIVFGSGYGIMDNRHRVPGKLDIRFLRGPLSCAALGLPGKLAVSDSAYLFGRRFRELAQDVRKTRKVGYIPHHASAQLLPQVWKSGEVGRNAIDPMGGIETFVRQVAGCERIVTEALHGAIAADALRIPFTIVQTSPLFNAFKWQDWLEAMALDLRIGGLSAEGIGDGAGRSFQLSGDRRLEEVEARIWGEFDRLRQEISALSGEPTP